MFNRFLSELGELLLNPVPLKYVKKLVKIDEKCIPKNIHLYYSEFIKHINSKWQRKDKLFFIWTVLKYLQLQGRGDHSLSQEDWQNVGHILEVKPALLHAKWLSMLKTDLRSNPWSEEEDVILSKVMTQGLDSWTDVALEFNRQGNTMRHAKQLRERWNNYLNPDLNKGQWGESEQIQLLQLVQKHGKKWSQLAKFIKGRTENQVKNAYNSLVNHYRKNNIQSLESEEEIVIKLLSQLDPSLQQMNSNTHCIQSPIMFQQSLLMQAILLERLKSLAYLAQFGKQ